MDETHRVVCWCAAESEAREIALWRDKAIDAEIDRGRDQWMFYREPKEC